MQQRRGKSDWNQNPKSSLILDSGESLNRLEPQKDFPRKRLAISGTAGYGGAARPHIKTLPSKANSGKPTKISTKSLGAFFASSMIHNTGFWNDFIEFFTLVECYLRLLNLGQTEFLRSGLNHSARVWGRIIERNLLALTAHSVM